ncbi:MAG: right-handed parallel beta-helix repeat-containing protein [Steroidobacteraceae bacterium]|nr:right-handed parallel beta-helix repeat-containing protein [Steroidobacteraceae bacterium]
MTRHEPKIIPQLEAACCEPEKNGTVVLDPVAFEGWAPGLRKSAWVLTNGRETIALGSDGNARMAIELGASRYLLAGANGHSSIQAAIDAAQGGEIILIAPGTYEERCEFTMDEDGSAVLRSDACGLVISKSVTLQGVTDDGAPILDADDVVATVVATCASANGVSFAITADNVTIQGLALIPASAPDVADGGREVGKVLDVRGAAFTLRCCVIKSKAPHRVLSAVSFSGSDLGAGSVVSGNRLYGTITLPAGAGLRASASPTLLVSDNETRDIPVANGSPKAPEVTALVALDDNARHTVEDSDGGLIIEDHDIDERSATPTQHSLDAYIVRLLRNHSGVGAAVLDAAGHVRKGVTGVSEDGAGLRETYVYRSIQAAIDAAGNGDTVLISPGTYVEALTIERKSITLRAADGEKVTIAPMDADAVALTVRGSFDAEDSPGRIVVEGITFKSCACGIHVTEDTKLDTLLVRDAQFTGIRRQAIYVGEGPAAANGASGLAKLIVQDSDFSGSGFALEEGGVLELRRYGGDLEVVRSTFAGGTHPGAAPANVIELYGSRGARSWPLGRVRLSGVVVTGHFAGSVLRIRHFSDVCGLAITPDSDLAGLDLTDAVPGSGRALDIQGFDAAYDASGYSLLYPFQADSLPVPVGRTPQAAERISRDAGIERAVFSGRRADYEITLVGQDLLINSGDEGLQGLSDIRVLSFRDCIVDLTRPVWLVDTRGCLKSTYGDIQSALDAAQEGERLVVGAGTYEQNLRIVKAVTLSGANVALTGTARDRKDETVLRGHITVGPEAESAVVDGFTIIGSITTGLSPGARQRFVIQNSVIDGSGTGAAISLMNGATATIANNRIIGGADEAIYVPYGFGDLAITGNRIEAAVGSAAIALGGGSGVDRVHVLGNTIMGGDYGVLIEVSSGFAQAGDAIHIAGNTFGDPVERCAPAVACVYADDFVPESLRPSLGVSVSLNTYFVTAPAVEEDVHFETLLSDELSPGAVMRLLCDASAPNPNPDEQPSGDRAEEASPPALEPYGPACTIARTGR